MPMQILCFKQKVTFDNHKNVISNEEHGACWGAYHITYNKAHIAIDLYMNVMGIVLNSKTKYYYSYVCDELHIITLRLTY